MHLEMKWFSNIIITLTMLILLVFGAGGIGVSKCACSGKISFLMPLEQGCCPMDSDCMTITVVHFSAGEFQQSANIPQPQPMQLASAPMFVQPECCHSSVDIPVIPSGRPPTGFVETIVLRV